MKIAIITANVGGFDQVIPPVEQSLKFDYFSYTEENLPFPLDSFDNRMKAKYLKLQTHRFLPGYNAYIWLDGRVEVTSSDLVRTMIYAIAEADIMCLEHPERNNVYEELEFILAFMEAGNEYLLDRYNPDAIKKELELYRSKDFPAAHPLYACGVFARWNNQKVNDFFDEWWRSILEFSCFDQAMFSYCAVKEKINIVSIPYNNELLKINKHL